MKTNLPSIRETIISLLILCPILAVARPLPGMALMGDAGREGSELNRLEQSIQREHVNSLVLPGDNLYAGTYSSVWGLWKQAGLHFDVVAIGNHNGGYQNEVQYFSMPGEYYSIVRNGARFIVLNSDNSGNVDTQFDWLEREINQVPEELVFLVYHHPTFTISKGHSWTDKKSFQIRMRRFLREHGSRLTAIIVGHDHISEFVKFGNVPVIVSGAGREVLSNEPVAYQEDGFYVETQYLTPMTQHWALLEIEEGAREATVHFVRVEDQKRVCSARLVQRQMFLQDNCHQ